jgi:dolichol-phosphate mannosyltransferase
MQYAVENRYRYAIFMDAGLSHNPKEIPLFMKHPSTDLLIGCRTSKFNTPLFRQLLSGVGNFIYNICLDFPRSMFGQYYGDISSGFRRYSYKAMKLLLSKSMQSKSFDIMLESAHQIHKSGLSISEIPISYRFSNSSLNGKVIWDCIGMCCKLIFRIA